MPHHAVVLVLMPVSMLVTAGACSDSCASGSGFGCAEEPLWTTRTGEGSVSSVAGALTALTPSSVGVVLAGAGALPPGPPATTAAEGLDEAGTTVVPLNPGSFCVATTSAVAGWASGAEAVG